MTLDPQFWTVFPNHWELGSVGIAGPGDQPLSPDQSSFPISWSSGPTGAPGLKMNSSPTRSAHHPMGRNGNDSSRVRQFSVVCVDIPHEKHPSADTVDALGDCSDWQPT